MITITNYLDQKENIDWKNLSKELNDLKNDIDDIIEFYNDDDDIKETVDLFFDKINKAKSTKKIFVIYKDGKFLTKKTLESPYSFTDNENFAYTYKEKDRAESIAEKYDALVLTLSEAKEMNKLYDDIQKKLKDKYNPKFKKGDYVEVVSGTEKGNFGRVIKVHKERNTANYEVLKTDEDEVELNENHLKLVKRQTIQDVLLNAKYVRSLMPKLQQMAVLEAGEGEEKEYFIELVKQLENDFEQAQKRQNKPLFESIVKAHYFYGDSHWFILDYEPQENSFFGYVVLNGDTEMSEAGYISTDELMSIKRLELDFHFTKEPLGKILHDRYPNDFPEPEKIKQDIAKADKPKKKVEKSIDKKEVDNYSIEYMLIKRFFNMVKEKEIYHPFRKVQLLYNAFMKAAIERKVRKTSEDADLFNQVKDKITTIYKDFAEPNEKDVKIKISDNGFYNKLESYASERKVSPIINLMKRFVSMQGTMPDVKKAQTLLNSIKKNKTTLSKENRFYQSIDKAIESLESYIKKPVDKVDVFSFGLSSPRSMCTNRIKCTGIDKNGKLHKGYKFQEKTGNVIRVKKKGLSSSFSQEEIDNAPTETIIIPKGNIPVLPSFNTPVAPIVPVSPVVQQVLPVVKEVDNFEPGLEKNISTNEVRTTQTTQKKDFSNRPKNPYVKPMSNCGANENATYFDFYGPLGEFLGNLEKKPVESVVITIDAPQGAGKTRLLFQILNMVGSSGYSPLFLSLEEHPDSSLFTGKRDEYLNEQSKQMVDTMGALPETPNKLFEILENYEIVLIDSFGKLFDNIDLDKDIRKRYNGKLFFIIYQRTQDGKMRGGSASQFDADCVMKIEKDALDFKNSYAYFDKNRYQNIPLGELKYNIYSKDLM